MLQPLGFYVQSIFFKRTSLGVCICHFYISFILPSKSSKILTCTKLDTLGLYWIEIAAVLSISISGCQKIVPGLTLCTWHTSSNHYCTIVGITLYLAHFIKSLLYKCRSHTVSGTLHKIIIVQTIDTLETIATVFHQKQNIHRRCFILLYDEYFAIKY